MDKKRLNICICGGGSLGIVCSGVFLSQGHNVNLLTGHPAKWSSHIKVTDPEGKIYEGTLGCVSDKAADVIPECDIVLLCVPGYLIGETLGKIKNYLGEKALVGSIVSSTGFFFMAHDILPSSTGLFGFQRVPYISRQKEYGHSGLLLGYKDSVKIAFENIENVEEWRKIMEDLFMTPTQTTSNFLEVSLTNSNPILHTGRLYAMWRESKGKSLSSEPLFYSDWTDLASDYLIKMDEEFQSLLRKLDIEENAIPTLLSYYESSDAESLTRKIKSIPAFKSIKTPMVKTDGGWELDYKSRYFTEDFPFGLRFIKELADQNGIPIPVIDEVYSWGISRCKNKNQV